MSLRRALAAIVAFSLLGAAPHALVQSVAAENASMAQTQADAFTRYELNAPSTESFRIYYYVSGTTAGAKKFYNQIRPGSEPTVHGVYDRMSGKRLDWKIVKGADARASGLIPGADETSEFIRVNLERPVPAAGRGRLLIDKTYKDPASYYEKDGVLTFSRRLGVKRNAVVLPEGYELLSVNYPSQIQERDDGRLEVSFINPGTEGVPLEIKAQRFTPAPAKKMTIDGPKEGELTSTRPVARVDAEIPQRASQTRDIVYFLQQPETHSFRLYHDYEELRAGVDRYLNVVRPGSRASNPSAKILDTGEVLTVETLLGKEITKRKIDIGEPVKDDTELVAIWFDPVKEGQSKLLRIEETYTDAGRYFLLNPNEFLWDRSLGRSRNTIILPEGWRLTSSATPTTVSTKEDGRVELRFLKDGPGAVETLIRGKRKQ